MGEITDCSTVIGKNVAEVNDVISVSSVEYVRMLVMSSVSGWPGYIRSDVCTDGA